MTSGELIRHKREGGALEAKDIESRIEQIVTGDVPDYQVSALLMAIYFKGLNAEELATWTSAMLHSGDVLTLDGIDKKFRIDMEIHRVPRELAKIRKMTSENDQLKALGKIID